jgi:hypothetical protein
MMLQHFFGLVVLSAVLFGVMALIAAGLDGK